MEKKEDIKSKLSQQQQELEERLRNEWKFQTPTSSRISDFLDVIGSGAYGAVFRAKDPMTNQVVAIKTWQSHYRFLDEVLREILVSYEIGNQYKEWILPIHRVHISVISPPVKTKDPLLDIVAIYPEAREDLATALLKIHTWPMKKVLQTIYSIACGLEILHSLDITHNDMKPRNVLLFGDNTVKLADFGLSVVNHPLFRRPVDRLVTSIYRAPEMWCVMDTSNIVPNSVEEKAEYDALIKQRRAALLYPGEWGEHLWTPKVDNWALGIMILEIVASLRLKTSGLLHLYLNANQFGLADIIRAKRFASKQSMEVCRIDEKKLPWHLFQVSEQDKTIPVEPKAGTDDGVAILNSLFKKRLYQGDPPGLVADLLSIASQLLRWNPSERLTARGVIHSLKEAVSRYNWRIKNALSGSGDIINIQWSTCPIIESPLPIYGSLSRLKVFEILYDLRDPKTENGGNITKLWNTMIVNPRIKNHKESLLHDLWRILFIKKKIVQRFDIENTRTQQSAFLIGVLITWGGSVIEPLLQSYKKWGFPSLDAELKSIVDLFVRVVAPAKPLNLLTTTS